MFKILNVLVIRIYNFEFVSYFEFRTSNFKLKVLFTQNIKNMAQMGDIKEVASGYARNFLFPRNLAEPATSRAKAQADLLKKRRLDQEVRSKEEAGELLKLLENVVIEIEIEASDSGSLYGSVDAKRIVDELGLKKIKVKPEQINLAEPIKKIGEYDVEIELHPEARINIKVSVKGKSSKEEAKS